MIKRGIKFFIDANLLLSFATVFLAVATTMQLGLKPQASPVLAVLFFATFLVYNIGRIRNELNKKYDKNSRKSVRESSLHFVLVSFIISALSTFVLINDRKISTTPYFHRGLVDGTLLIQPLLVLIFYYLEKLM